MAQPTTCKVVKVPEDALALTNCLIVCPKDWPEKAKYVTMVNPQAPTTPFTFTIRRDERVGPHTVAASGQHRRWALLSLNMDVTVKEFVPLKDAVLAKLNVEIDTLQKGKVVSETLKSEELAAHFANSLAGNMFTVEELIAFEFHGINFSGRVREVTTVDPEQLLRGGSVPATSNKPGADGMQPKGILKADLTQILFLKAQDSTLKLEGSARSVQMAPIISPDFKFEDMGIGGLDKEFKEIFRRAFASRIFPMQLVQELGIRHVRGLLLFGPPGTGKTLIARQIGKLLKAREPKIVNGPEILNKYVGQAEENIRNLFKDAEAEYKAKGDESALHMIIFDEIDAICKQRGSRNDGTGVGDSVVNQLLSKLDGVEQLNNILVIGMTNRKDLLDDALLRPGRLEVHVEIGLPDETGRLQILKIHTSEARKHKRLAGDDRLLERLAGLTKNFSGAEIQGLVNSAASFTMNRNVHADAIARVKGDLKDFMITEDDFMLALKEVKPAFGVTEEDFTNYAPNDIIRYSPAVEKLLDEGRLYIRQTLNSPRTPLVSLLLHGAPGSGKTAIASTLAKGSNFPFIKFITPDKLVGYPEPNKCSLITKTFEDAYKSKLSVIVVDAIERLLEYVNIGPRFSNMILQTLIVLMTRNPPPGHRLLIIATTSERNTLDSMGMSEVFSGDIRVPTIQTLEDVRSITRELELFVEQEEKRAFDLIRQNNIESRFAISIKRLLNVIERARQDEEKKIDKFVEDIVHSSSI